MKYFSLSFLLLFVFIKTANSAYLPVVDVSRGNVSARAAFGEEITPANRVAVEQGKKSEKKVVARSAKKSAGGVSISSGSDILKPNRPSSDLWAKNGEEPLRMPRIDEIAVLNSDALLPEESLDTESKMVAERVTHNETIDEIQHLRAEVARLAKLQQEQDKKIANARPAVVRTPIAAESDAKPVATNDGINVRRKVVAMDNDKDVAVRSANNTAAEPKFTSVKEMSKMSPNELKKAFKKTYLSENKHLSTYSIDDRYDEVSDMSSSIEGFSASRDLSEMDGGVRPLEVKISFLNGDSGLSRENYNLLSETASIVVNNPKRAIQIAIPESATYEKNARKLASRRLAIVEQVLRDTGVAEQRIVPVLSQRDDDVFVLRIISSDTFDSLTQQKRNMFGDSVSKKTYKSMSW